MRNLLLLLLSFVICIQSVIAEGADSILIQKSKRQLTLLRNDKEVAQYSISLGGEPSGPKQCQGDNKTPEGEYIISGRNSNSSFHRALKISYPNESDRKNAKRLGCTPGDDIMIHGLPNGRGWLGILHRLLNWTRGCIAVRDSEIDEIWNLVPDGARVRILP